MKAVIIAAARSPRLLPLTKNTPVSLLEIAGKAIIEHQLETLQEAGIKDTLVITGFCAEQIEKVCVGKVSFIFNPFYQSCNVAMNLWMVRQELKSGFLLHYNDTIFKPELIRELLATDKNILLAVDRSGIDKESEKITMQKDTVASIGKDVTEPYGEFIGIAKFSPAVVPSIIAELEQIARNDLDTNFPRLMQRLIEKGHGINIHTTDYDWMDIDFPNDLEEGRQRWPL